jgi:nucleoside-diphosphate-sugar epimerase
MSLKVIITGATGMVGEGVLHECLQHPEVEEVLVINRRPVDKTHPKLKEIIHQDFMDFSPIRDQLKNYQACFFCLGVSSVGMKEPRYYELTYTLTLNAARILAEENPNMIFCYISGSGTDSSEKGRSMWARVKGKTENDLMKLSFRKVYAFRPGYLHPTKGLKNVLKGYRFVSWLYPLWRGLFPRFVTTLKQLGLAMINIAIKGYPKNVIEVEDIKILAKE